MAHTEENIEVKPMRNPKKSAPGKTGKVPVRPESKIINFGGSLGAILGQYLLSHQRRTGLNLVGQYTAIISHDADAHLITDEFNKGNKRWYDLDEVMKNWFGDIKGGYRLPSEKASLVLQLGHNGFSKKLADYEKAICRDPGIIKKFDAWRGLVCRQAAPISVIIDIGSKAGSTASNAFYQTQIALSRPPAVEIDHTLRVLYLEYDKNKDYLDNQALNIVPHLHSDSAFYDVWIVYDDKMHKPAMGTAVPDATQLDREHADRLIIRGLNGLLCSKSYDSANQSLEVSDIFAIIEGKSRSKLMAVFGGIFPVPMLERGKIYQWGHKIAPGSIDSERIDIDSTMDSLEQIFTAFRENPWAFAMTYLDADREDKYLLSQPGFCVVLGCGGIHPKLVHSAWLRAHMDQTNWTLLPATYGSKTPYISIVLFYMPYGNCLGFEEIFGVSYPFREVQSFRSIIMKKDQDEFFDRAREHYKNVAKVSRVADWTRPLTFRGETRQWHKMMPLATHDYR